MTEANNPFSHLNDAGEVHMVDIHGKDKGYREATASAIVRCAPATIEAIATQAAQKGDVLAVMRVAAIMGAKRTPEIIPLAHPISIHGANVTIELNEDSILIRVRVKTSDQTGIEMEALTGASCAALTGIDMVKGMDPHAYIERVWLEEKIGGKRGCWRRD